MRDDGVVDLGMYFTFDLSALPDISNYCTFSPCSMLATYFSQTAIVEVVCGDDKMCGVVRKQSHQRLDHL
jgi:deoxycytidylate deaminase